jgi:hypothetical protein
MGLHSSALKYFLRGGTPYVHTLTRLVDWYNGRARDVTVADLLGMLPAPARPGAPALLIDAIRQACAEVGERLPPGVLAVLAPAASPPTHAPPEGAAP